MLDFVGCGAALNPKLYNNNAYFWIDDDLYLLDCGETSFRQHYMLGHFDRAKKVTVLVTHLHTDHIGSLGTLIVNCYLKWNIRPVVYCVEAENLKTVFTLTGVEPHHYELFSDYRLTGDDRITVTPCRVRHHDIMVRAYGFLIGMKGKKIYYSGDAAEIPEQIVEMLKNGELDEVYQDTSVEDHSGAHNTLDKLEKIIPEAYRAKVYCMHYDGEFFELIRSKGFGTIEDRVDPRIRYRAD